jgi:hypothetical protein
MVVGELQVLLVLEVEVEVLHKQVKPLILMLMQVDTEVLVQHQI